ncbi:DUF4376 domain-containing protein [Fusobacterium necrophorum]|uniref:DUF4376 domain-containing protein n=1 Tax=Fusobacterium necrophorum TaxID=859 RepID=UPI0007883A2A|nr:DUF4376 domain-containing protein [Fusobacterium necrophorum]AYV95942.1 DUF4376 domain-containing protein [Fusobacterium necrophorum subsp. funduliforme]KYL03896.1 hypothetical protein A2J06_07785 [Fusobacterium necrophorum subsp. funduliforme]
MKKYIFRVQDLKQGNMIPYNVLDLDEKTPENTETETFIALEIEESYDIDLFLYDKEKQEVRRKSKKELYDNGLYTLKIGEIFDETSQDFKTLDQPSRWHTWNGKTWEVNIEEVREIKRQELKHIREQKISENIEVHGSLFQVREKDLENFEDVARAIRRKKKTEEDTRAWILADNSIKTFTYAQLLDVLDERALRKEKIFNEYGSLAIQLQQANTVKQIEKITWEAKK